MDLINIKAQEYSFFGEHCFINGNLKLSGDTMISSMIEGELVIKDRSNLQVDRNGYIKGSIICHNLSVYGTIEGSIEASGKVVVYSTAKITGKITTDSLKIYAGAVVNMEGHSEQL
jgi:cytoskeletal protein CcmA (bactofilin family)